uniref:sorting nexin-11 n=1 Tax=Scatophagus argus TaxID=75038 RepID=UPI001ED81372|nr:sorting nexin-11 [Scatophagus argus]XP_046233167.1 sorting nexin-11 [Scatophagus argus]
MISNQEEDEFIAVRVQDPRVQNEGSWNSYVDYKIFLHTNSKAFTAKTSCVRRRYSEFVWLKKKLQKNAGLVPVPDLPGKSFFSFSNEDFLEGRRKGLQAFLDKVVHMTVCLSDSQLHLFLQTQLPVSHIQDCVQGHTPYSVTDAILTYASSNQGFAQAQEDVSIKEPSLTISYESMESPVPHQPCLQTKETFSPELVSVSDSDPLDGLLQPCDDSEVEVQHKEKSSVRVLQKNNHLEAIVEDCGATEVSFFLGDSQDDPESLSLAEQTPQRSCQIQTPVEVHSPMGTGFEVNCEVDRVSEGSVREENVTTVAHPDTEEKADQQQSCEEANTENKLEMERSVNSVAVLDFKNGETGSQEGVCSEEEALEHHIISEVNGLEPVAEVNCQRMLENSNEPDDEISAKSESKEEAPLESKLQEENHYLHSAPRVERGDDDAIQKQVEQEEDLVGTKDESDDSDDDESHSLPSSNESIVKVSDEESDEAEDSIQTANGRLKTSREEVTLWSEVESSSRNILDLHMNGKEDMSSQEDIRQEEDLQYLTEINDLSKSLDLDSTVTGGDLTENSDFSILETSCSPGLADSKRTEQETVPALSLDASAETQEVELTC